MKFPITGWTVALAAVVGGTVVALGALHQLPPALVTGIAGIIVGVFVPSEAKP